MSRNAEFDHYAQNYDELLRIPLRQGFVQDGSFFHLRKWILIANFLQRHSIQAGELSWLDVGCGKGELLRYGRSHFRSVAGCDPSQEMVRDVEGLEVHRQEAPAALPFANASFDFVTAVCVYHHVGEPHRIPLTLEIKRILRPAGIFCMIEHNPFNPVTQIIVKRCPVDVGARLLTSWSARVYTGNAGLTHIETQYFLYLPEKYYAKLPVVEGYLSRLPLGGQYAMFSRKCLDHPNPALAL